MRNERSQPEAPRWRISEIAPDFERIDTWALPVTARRSELGALEGLFLRLDPDADAGSRLATMLFALRARLGRWFGWDKDANALPIPGCRETSLRERLPADLRGRPAHQMTASVSASSTARRLSGRGRGPTAQCTR